MAYSEQFTCDTCGKVKQITNHWWMYDPPPLTGNDNIGFVLWQWNAKEARNCKLACGQECLIKAVSQWLQEHSQ